MRSRPKKFTIATDIAYILMMQLQALLNSIYTYKETKRSREMVPAFYFCCKSLSSLDMDG